MGFQRARQPEQKQQRRADLLAAAAALFSEHGFDGVSLKQIAAGAGVSKAAVYRYFDSKEQMFLVLLIDDYSRWVDALELHLGPLAGSNDPDAVANAVVDATLEIPRLPALGAIVTSVLEHNVSVETVVTFKAQAVQLMTRILPLVHGALPALDLEQITVLLRTFLRISNSLWHEAHPPPVVDEVLGRPEFQMMRVDYETELRESCAVVLRGLLAS